MLVTYPGSGCSIYAPVELKSLLKMSHITFTWVGYTMTLVEDNFRDQIACIEGSRDGSKCHYRSLHALPENAVWAITWWRVFIPSITPLLACDELDIYCTYPLVLAPSDMKLNAFLGRFFVRVASLDPRWVTIVALDQQEIVT